MPRLNQEHFLTLKKFRTTLKLQTQRESLKKTYTDKQKRTMNLINFFLNLKVRVKVNGSQ